MRRFNFRFKRAVGSEIISVGAVLLFLAMLVAVMTWYGGYTASIEGQILSDVIADGSVRFAKCDMRLQEEALQAMAKKLYDKNCELVNGQGFCTISGYSINVTDLSETGGTSPYLSAHENSYLAKRNDVASHSGTLTAMKFKYTMVSAYKNTMKNMGLDIDDKVLKQVTDRDTERGIDKNSHTTGEIFAIDYSGPAFKDQMVHVTVTSHGTVPVIGKEFPRTGTSTVLSRADVPYNSRKPIQGMLNTLENFAFAGVMKAGVIDVNSGDLPVYGSIQQKAILNAMRYVGDSYWRGGPPCTPHAWPAMNIVGEYLDDSADVNKYKDCSMFVSACYSMGAAGQKLTLTMAEYEHEVKSRNVKIERSIPAEEIWEEMHKNEVVEASVSPVNGRYIIKKYNAYQVAINHPERKKSQVFYITDKGYWAKILASGKVQYLTTTDKDGKKVSCLAKDYTASVTKYSVVLTPKDKGISLAEAMAKYAPDGGSTADNSGTNCWAITGMDPWDESILEPGDVLVFINPNWQQHIAAELVKIYNCEKRSQVAGLGLNDPSGKNFVCHYAMYIGKGKVAESTVGVNGNGGQVNDLRGFVPQEGSTCVIKSIYRFATVSPKSKADKGQNFIGDGDIEFDNYVEEYACPD